jgi:TetR/AcrR family transcriptional regulator
MVVDTGTGGRRAQRRGHAQRLGRDHLLDAAEEVFGRNGFHETSLKDVAAAAEFSVGTIYNFFENKDDLFRSIFERRGEAFMTELRALTPAAGDPVDQLHAVVDFEVGFFRTQPHFARLYLRYASSTLTSTDAQIADVTRARYDEAMQIQAELFARGQAVGAFRAGDPVVLAHLFSGLVASFQSTDPVIVTGDPAAAERLPLTELHAVVDGAFRS